MPPAISVENLVKRYRGAETNAVDGVTFDVESGSFFVLLGPNGAGKTTTISIVTTTLVPTSGRVIIAGYDAIHDAAAVRREVGIIFQRPSLDQNLTAEENVRFHAVLYGLYPFRPTYGLMPRAYRDQVEELASVLQLGDEIFKPVRTYSGGMKRKLEIIRSLIHRPRVLFLDEPTVGLDPASRRNVWEYIRNVRATSGTTVFLTTHYLDEAESADEVCIIKRGKIITRGTPDRVKADLAAQYLLVDAADRDALRSELRSHAIPFEEGEPLRIPVDGRSAHAILRSIETPLTVVQTHLPTLEDAYLQIVERDDA
ncbi:MAG: ATP-binding cassette domain-containing protein [Chloroflexota bacterium]|nr:MAG: ATP-binding cassette domain-containing protein [Chloroflexota bacterium]